MDNKKDIHETGQKPLQINGLSDYLRSDDERVVFFVHKKLEKISAALYLITNNFSDAEPLKWELRKSANELIKKHISFFTNSSGGLIEIEQLISSVLGSISLVDLSFESGLISYMNREVIKKEILSILSQINDPNYIRIKRISGQKLGANFFEVPGYIKSQIERSSTPDTSNIAGGESAAMNDIGVKDNFKRTETGSREQKDFALSNSPQVSNLKDFSPVSVKKNKRKSIIVNLIKRRKVVMIKDVMEVISDCSEKTIQRELASLVREGVLTKSGNRRWTKYTLSRP